MLDLKEIRSRLEKSSPGPWMYDEGSYGLGDTGDYIGYSQVTGPNKKVCYEETDDEDAFDFKFIAHARQDIPALLDEVERLREEIEEMKHEQSKRDWR